MRQRAGQNRQGQFWIIEVPETRVERVIWRRWHHGGYVALGWPPPGHGEDREHGFSFENEARSTDPNWTRVRNCLREMKVGDKIIPHLLPWRIGPVGIIRALHVKDSEWRPTVGKDTYWVGFGDDRHLSTVPELGRRIDVVWQSQDMPLEGKVALVPTDPYSRIARHAVQKPFNVGRYSCSKLVEYLGDRDSWVVP